MSDLKFASLNLRGLRNENKRRAMFNYLRRPKYDLICLQETHSNVGDEMLWKAEWGGQIIMSHGTQNSKGVAVLIQKNSRVRVNKITIHEDGHYVLVSLKVNDITMLLVNVYGPNTDEPQFFDEIIEKIKQYDEANVMFMGDFNLALNSLLDRADGGNYSPKATEKLHIIMDELGLLDAWRVLNPESKRFS